MRRVGTALALAAAALAAGCGSTEIDADKAEDFIRTKLTGPDPRAVDCPDGVEAKKGGTFNCTVTYADNTKATVTVHMTDDEGSVRVGPEDFKPQ